MGSNIQLIAKAKGIFRSQQRRCYEKTGKAYKFYGSKGIIQEYSREEFVSWFLKNYNGQPLDSIVIGRNDHQKNYSFDNIKFETRSESSYEMAKRTSKQRGKFFIKKVGIFSKKTNECIAIFGSVTECAKFFDADHSGITRHCTGKHKTTIEGFKWYYRFVSDELGTISS